MKKMFFLAIILMASLVWGQGFETFDNSTATGSYTDGNFVGDNGFVWNFYHSRDEATFPIDGNGLMLRRADEPSQLTATIPGGMGNFSVDTRKAFTGNTQRKLELVINGNVIAQHEPAFGDGGDDTVIPFVVNNINTPGSIDFILRLYGAAGNQQIILDNIEWTGFSDGSNMPPVITNITQYPEEAITPETTVSVSADVTDPDGTVELVELHWGTEAGSYPNVISMPLSSGDTYVTSSDIPAQTADTSIYYVVYAEDDEEASTTSMERSYTVIEPSYTALPYYEPFDEDLGDCYTYSVQGDSKEWEHNIFDENGYAMMNGFNSGEVEEDWLILPGINFNNYENVIMNFETAWNFGENDENNYLKLLYSTNYQGIGNPTGSTWIELPFDLPPTDDYEWHPSGDIDLSQISGSSVWIAFKYHYEPGNYRRWHLDNIHIDGDFSESENNVITVHTELDAAYPNPFNPETTIAFSLEHDSQLTLAVYNVKGQKVRTLVSDTVQKGHHSVVWDGTTDNGTALPSGVYMFIMQTPESRHVRKTILMK